MNSGNPERSIGGGHEAEAPLLSGTPLPSASWCVVIVHGRGGTPEGMLPIVRAAGAGDAAVIAPRASGGEWYPHRFLDAPEKNQPHLDAARRALDAAIARAADAGIATERTLLIGFSQGACLLLDHVERRASSGMMGDAAAAPVGALAALAGAALGDRESVAQRAAVARASATSALTGTRVLLASGDADEHIPVPNVRETGALFEALGASVDLRIYPGVGHSIVGDQLQALRALVTAVRPS